VVSIDSEDAIQPAKYIAGKLYEIASVHHNDKEDEEEEEEEEEEDDDDEVGQDDESESEDDDSDLWIVPSPRTNAQQEGVRETTTCKPSVCNVVKLKIRERNLNRRFSPRHLSSSRDLKHIPHA